MDTAGRSYAEMVEAWPRYRRGVPPSYECFLEAYSRLGKRVTNATYAIVARMLLNGRWPE
jgi:hypothetical protein